MIKLRLPKLKLLRQKFKKLSRKQKIVALVFGGVIVSGMIFVLAELGGYGVNGPATSPNSLDYGLVGYWDMEEGIGQVVKDKSGNGNDGTLGVNSSVGTDDPVFAPGHDASGPAGTALGFDGIDDRVDAGNVDAVNGLASFSVSAWVKTDTLEGGEGGLRYITAKEGLGAGNTAYILRLDTSVDLFEFYVGGTDYVQARATTPVVAGVWYHVIGTFDGSNVRIYVNGQTEKTTAKTGVIGSTTESVEIGHLVFDAASVRHWDGSLDEVRIYNRAISADEVRLLYNQKKPVLEMKFDEGSGTIAHDESFNNNDGTLGGDGLGTDLPTWVAGKNGGALDFDGSDDYVDIINGSSLNMTSQFSVGAWIKQTGNSGIQEIIDSYGFTTDKYWSLYSEDGIITFQWRDDSLVQGSITSDSVSAPDQWIYVMGVRGNGKFSLFINGVKQSIERNDSYGNIYSESHIGIGKQLQGVAYPFNGVLDDVRIYNYARTADEVLTDYNGGMAAHLGKNSNNSNGIYRDWYESSDWQYRQTVTVTNQVASALTDYQVKLTVNTATLVAAGKMQADGDDIRFTDAGGNNIPYWIETGMNTASTSIWIKTSLTASEVKSLYMYYGYSSATVTSNISSVMIFGDDFENGVTGWNNVGNGTFAADSAVKYDGTYSGKFVLGSNSYIEKMLSSTVTTGVLEYNVRTTQTNAFINIPGMWSSSITNWKGTELHFTDTAKFASFDGSTETKYSSFASAQWYKIKLALKSTTQYDFYIDGSLAGTEGVEGSLSSYDRISCGKYTTYPTTIYLDNLFLRQYAATEPTTSLSSETTPSTWQYRQPITVTNQVASVLTDYQAKLTIDTATLVSAGKMRSTGGDIRITDANNNNLPYWIESGMNSSTTLIWVQTDLTASQVQTLYMYYGNSVAISTSNISAVMIFGDDFETGISKWSDYNPAGSFTSDSSVKYAGGASGKFVGAAAGNSYIEKVFGSSMTTAIVEANVRPGQTATYSLMLPTLWGGAFANWAGMDVYFANSGHLAKYYNSIQTDYGTYAIQFYKMKLVYKSISQMDWYADGSLVTSNVAPINSLTAFDRIELGYYYSALGYYDNIFVRQYVATEPTSTAGSEEVPIVLAVSSAPDAPILHLRFDEGTAATAYDDSINNNDVTLVNAPAWVAGKFSSALDLESGSSQYGYAADSASLSRTGDLTLSAWIKPESVTASTLFDIGGKWDGANESYLLAQYGDEIRMYIDSSSNYKTTTAANLSAGTMYHVEAVYDASAQTVDIYVDGMLLAGTVTGTIPASIGDDAGRFQVGAEDSTTTAANFYDGVIDDFRVYGYARTIDQVYVDYNGGMAAYFGYNDEGLNRGLVGYWDMEEGSGQTIYDKSGNGNNGALGASTASETDDPVFSAGHDSSGMVGMGLLGDGGTDYVNVGVGTNLALTNLGAISLWIKPNSLAQDNFANFVTRRTNATGGSLANYSYSFHWRGLDSTIRMAVSNGDGVNMIFTSIPILTDTNWHHLVGMWDGSFLTIYKDGVLASTPTAQTINSQAGAAFSTTLLGNCFSTSATNRGEFNGTIDEVRMYNRALSTDEISMLYNQKKPVLEMKFDEGSGTVAHDESFNDNDGTLGGGTAAYMPVWTQGKFGSALSFDGSNDYVDISNALPIYSSTAYSTSLWVKGASGQVDMRLFSQGASANSLPLLTIGTGQLGTTGKLDVFFRDENGVIYLNHVESDGVAFDGNWHHVVWTDAAGSAKMYIDGVPSGSFTYTPPASVFAYDRAALGAVYRSTLSNFFNGSMDDVRIYNYARTPSEVLTDYNNGLAAHLR